MIGLFGIGVARYSLRRFRMHRLLETQTGVTLVELMVVLAIIAITSAIAVPLFMGNRESVKLRGAARQVTTDLRLARGKAVSDNANYYVCFEPANARYLLSSTNDCTANVDKTVDFRNTPQYSRIAFQYGGGNVAPCTIGDGANPVTFEDIGSGKKRATFARNGTLIVGTSVQNGEVHLKNNQGETYCVRIDGVNGLAKVYKWDGAAWKNR